MKAQSVPSKHAWTKVQAVIDRHDDLIDFHALSSPSKTRLLSMYSDASDKSRVHCKEVCSEVLGKVLQFSLIVQKIVALCSYGWYRTSLSKFSRNITPSHSWVYEESSQKGSFGSQNCHHCLLFSPLGIFRFSSFHSGHFTLKSTGPYIKLEIAKSPCRYGTPYFWPVFIVFMSFALAFGLDHSVRSNKLSLVYLERLHMTAICRLDSLFHVRKYSIVQKGSKCKNEVNSRSLSNQQKPSPCLVVLMIEALLCPGSFWRNLTTKSMPMLGLWIVIILSCFISRDFTKIKWPRVVLLLITTYVFGHGGPLTEFHVF